MFQIDVPINGRELFEHYFNQYKGELSNSVSAGIIKTHYREEFWRIEERIESKWEREFWNHYLELEQNLVKGGVMPELEENVLPKQPLQKKLYKLFTHFELIVNAINHHTTTVDSINYPKKLIDEIVMDLTGIKLESFQEYMLDSISEFIEIDRIIADCYKDRINVMALLEAEKYTPAPEGTENITPNENESRGNPNWKDNSKGFDFWKKVADDANEKLINNPEEYQPRSDKYFISTNLKSYLSVEHEVGETTVSDNLKKYFKKNNRLFVPKNGY